MVALRRLKRLAQRVRFGLNALDDVGASAGEVRSQLNDLAVQECDVGLLGDEAIQRHRVVDEDLVVGDVLDLQTLQRQQGSVSLGPDLDALQRCASGDGGHGDGRGLGALGHQSQKKSDGEHAPSFPPHPTLKVPGQRLRRGTLSSLVRDPARLSARPQLRTLVMTDLVDSTALIERHADEEAAQIIRQIDALARGLLREHRGQEIDKTDGYLLLFERTIDGVRYTLALHDKLAALAVELGEDVQMRAAIHVGEVVLWSNPPEDVAAGAKPVEVEGLAKPVTARLMSLSHGGRTLLSAPAHDIARRAGPDLVWQSHGAYVFKGVTEPFPVYEVQPEGAQPRKAPLGSAKATPFRPRRRVRLLAGGVVALVGVAVAAVVLSQRSSEEVGSSLNVLGGGYAVRGGLDIANDKLIRAVKRWNRVEEIWFETRAGAPYLFNHPSAALDLGWADENLRIRPTADPRQSLIGLRQVWSGDRVERVDWIDLRGEIAVVETWTPQPDGTIERAFHTPNGKPTRNVVESHGYGGSVRTSRLDDLGREVAYWDDGPLKESITHAGWSDDNNLVARWLADPDGNLRPALGVARLELEHDAAGRVIASRTLGLAGEAVHGQTGCASKLTTHGPNSKESQCKAADGTPHPGLEGCHIAKSTLEGNVYRERCLDADGAPVVAVHGGEVYEERYDSRGRIVSKRILNADNTPAAPRGHIPSIQLTYDDFGLVLRETWQDADGEPYYNEVAGGFGVHHTYTARGQLASTTTLDGDGEPMVNLRGFATRTIRYEGDNLTEVRYVDGEGHPVLADGQRHAEIYTYGDDDPRAIRSTWLGVRGEPTVDPAGVHRRDYEWKNDKDRDQPSLIAAFGADQQPVLHPFAGLRNEPPLPAVLWCHRQTLTYVDDQSIIECFGIDGALRMNEHGWAVWMGDAGALNDPVDDIWFLDDQRQPIVAAYGFFRLLRGYDAQWNPHHFAAFDAADEPVQVGCADLERDFDPRGHATGERCFDAAGNLTAAPSGCATLVVDVSETGLMNSWTCLDPDGEPTPRRARSDEMNTVPPGTVSVRFEYDDRGRRTAGTTVHLDRSERTIRAEFDDRGNVTQLASFEGEAQSLNSRGEFHRQERDYDERGNLIERRYFDLDDQPTSGVARTQLSYDRHGRQTRVDHFDAAGAPSYDDGAPTQRYRVDRRGLVTSKLFEDGLGTPIAFHGCFEMTNDYDDAGHKLAEHCLDASGEPTPFAGSDGSEVRYGLDEAGRVTSTSCWMGAEPAVCSGGYHLRRTGWNLRGDRVARSWYDPNGEPLAEPGLTYVAMEFDYDGVGNQVAVRYVGADGAPAPGPDGCAEIRIAYRPDGQVADTHCADVD